MIRSILALALVWIAGCHHFNLLRKQTLTLDAPKAMELVVYRQVGKAGQRVMSPVSLIRGGQSIELEPGDYLIANECSGYEFKQTRDKPTKIPVRRLTLILHGERGIASVEQNKQMDSNAETSAQQVAAESPSATANDVNSKKAVSENKEETQPDSPQPSSSAARPATEAQSVVNTMCFDPLDGQRNEWNKRRDFEILPGTTEIRIGGRVVKFENHGETSEPIALDLYPVSIVSAFQDIQSRFYLTAEEKDTKYENFVVSLSANSGTWLLPGNYSLEVNGTRRKLTVEKGALTEISVGVLRIDLPKNFPLEDRLKSGGQPVFVYLDTGALLNLDTDYLVFPGAYKVSIEGSEVQDAFQVESGEKTVVKTFAARVDVPACPESLKSCKSPPRITIHREQKPYALMTVEPKLPFLLLEGAYEYGVEGLRGIKKSLQRRAEHLAGESLARVRFKWDVRQAQGRYRTDLVRIESRGSNVYGRSLDLLFHKPDEVYVPAGNYDVTYFIGDPVLERSKSRQVLHLEPGQTREVVIPLFMEKVSRSDDSQTSANRGAVGVENTLPRPGTSKQNDSESSPEKSSATLPRSLTPLRR
ncbi:hypothetical protein EBU99_02010 [bacterium]|nr:hypothetical protein [bacterium]